MLKWIEGRSGWALLAALGALFPLFAGNDYRLTVMSTAYIFAIATLGLNLITGYTGQFNMAHAGFMAIGAYTLGILTVDYHVPFWIAFVAAGAVTAAIGLPLGWLSLRLKGHYFSIFTMCVGVILFLVLEKWESLTHGAVGLMGIPGPSPIGPLKFETPAQMYYLMFAFLVLGAWVMKRITHSLLGRTFIAIRNGDDLAEALGIPLMRTKLLAFIVSVLYAGWAGALYAAFVRFVGPDVAGAQNTFDMTMYMLVGGLGTVFGPLLGSIAVPWLTQMMQFLQEYRFVIFGPLLIALVIFFPHGIAGSWMAWRARRAAAAVRPVAPATLPATEAPGA
ncbi:branched-chain amino acid ABC transporter permease [Ramlibacter sp. G-1-2-2]|uniref:Branched-chain amino acid ABC transporter permease n=1 Tax=Ramlibacter agri TaxID=2728837 RepID=A0A848H5S4_9BURK|nr:branched-chain amino acid ABC transporter permease [Ramlibacter agri]NML45857.1 branched-chain amino acid ABC transporter permease [Ramlibacter agri]